MSAKDLPDLPYREVTLATTVFYSSSTFRSTRVPAANDARVIGLGKERTPELLVRRNGAQSNKLVA
jgi:hypothetical protein